MFDPRDLAPDEFARGARALDVPEESIRKLIAAVVGRGIHEPATWAKDYQIPRRLREAIESPMRRLLRERLVSSPIDGFQKLLFRTNDGLPVESVLIPLHKPGAVSVCLSSQVGCAMGCVFCATARMASRRGRFTALSA